MAKFETICAQIGVGEDTGTGAISLPIYQTSTFEHPGLGQSTGFDYSRTINPTRKVLESALADLEKGCRGFAFTSGMAAISCVLSLFFKGDHLIFSEDLYGGTYRIFDRIYSNFGLTASFIDTTDGDTIKAAINSDTKALFIETPTNPTMRITDIRGAAAIAKEHGLLLIVDNTFMTPFLQKPLLLGADIVVHSATKYLAGHNDVLAGAAIVKDRDLGERLFVIQNSVGAVLSPFDSWLTIRGLKTLPLRLRQQLASAQAIAEWLASHPKVRRVYYPGLTGHPGHGLNKGQASGAGAVISFELPDQAEVARVLERLKIISYAESLGGVESLMTFPFTQTHKDIPAEIRRHLGVTEGLLRLSVGIEDTGDLVDELSNALS